MAFHDLNQIGVNENGWKLQYRIRYRSNIDCQGARDVVRQKRSFLEIGRKCAPHAFLNILAHQ
jgi:hypothetical protein